MNPPPGRFDGSTWAAITSAGEISALSIALNCSRRGDAKSLSALCKHLEEVGPGYLLASGQSMPLQDMMPQYADVAPGDWSDPAKARTPIAANNRTWEDCSLENIIAWCLARPTTADGRHVAPRNEAEDRGDINQGYVPPYKADLSADQHELLLAAMSCFSRIPKTDQRSSGIARLFSAVVGHVAWPGACQAFLDAGHAPAELLNAAADGGTRMDRTSHPPAIYAMFLGNPIGALAIEQAAGHTSSSEDRSASLYHKVIQGNPPKDGLTLDKTIHLLRKSVGDEALDHDPRFQALIALVNRTCESDAPVVTVQRSLISVAKHFDHLANLKWNEKNFACCDPFVRGVVQPLRELLPDDLVEGLSDLQAVRSLANTSSGNMARDCVRMILQTACAPALDALKPALPLIMSEDFWGDDHTYGGWNELTSSKDSVFWDPVQGMAHWNATMSIFKDVGLDPTQHFYEGGHTPESQEERRKHILNGNVEAANAISEKSLHKHTSLLHLVAEGSKDPIPKMLALLEMGADPSAVDQVFKTPAKRLKDGELRERWESIVRSSKARASAQDVLAEILGDEASSTSKSSITKGP